MASSGSFDTSTYNQGNNYPNSLTFSWRVASQSTANNKTVVDWSLYSRGGSSAYYVVAYQTSATINSTQVAYRNKFNLYGAGATTVGSGQHTISHNATGDANISASAKGGLSVNDINVSGSGSWALPNIPRNATISSATDFNDEGNPTITWSNPAGDSLSTLEAGIFSEDGQTAYAGFRNLPKSGTSSYTFELTDSERNALRAATPNSSTMKVRFYLHSVISSVSQSPYLERTLTIVNGNPTFSSFSYKDNNAAVTAVTGNNQVLVQGKSTLQATVSPAQKMVANKFSAPSTYNFQFGNTNVSAPYSDSASVAVELGTELSSGVQRLNVRAYDSRSFWTLAYKDITVIPYAAPIIDASVEREGGFETQTTLSISGAVSLVAVNGSTKNSVNASNGVKYRYKRSDTSSWNAWTPVTSSMATDGKITVADILMNMDNNYQWDFEVSITDRFGTTVAPIVLSVGIPILYVDKDGYVSINGMPDKSRNRKGLYVAPDDLLFDLIYPIGSIYISISSANPSTLFGGTWVPFGQGRTIVGVDTEQTEFNTVENTGGDKAITLTTEQMPSHSHTVEFWQPNGWQNSGSYGSAFFGGTLNSWNASRTSHQWSYNGDSGMRTTGGSKAHSNLQPYITTYMWKRTA